MSDEIVYETFVHQAGTDLCQWVFDDIDAAKETVIEFIEMKYKVDVGEWSKSEKNGHWYLDAGPDSFSAGVFVKDVNSSPDDVLEGMRESYNTDEATA